MKKIILSLIATVLLFSATPASAFWIWTPETNKWVNPKYDVKKTPQEQLEHAQELYAAGEKKMAFKEFEKVIKHYPRAREAAEAQFFIGEIQQKQGLVMKAFRSYQTVIDKYPFSERAGEVVKRQFEIGNGLMEGMDKRNKFVNAVSGGDYDPVEVLRQVIKNAPYGEYAPQAQYRLGLYLQEKQMYQEARDEYEKTINDYPESEWAQAARYQVALSDAERSSAAQYDQKVTEVAIQELEDFVEQNPSAALSKKAREQILKLREKEAENIFVVAEFYEKQKRTDAAKVYYAQIVDDYDKTSWAVKALKRIRELNTSP